MSAFTKFLNLFKWQPDIDGDEEFDIDKSLNENWDKIDTKLETYMTELSNDVEAFKNNTDTQVEEIGKQVNGLREISISPTQPTSNESVWIKKGKNLFNKNIASILNMYVDTSSNKFVDGYTATRSTYIEIEPNKTYTISKQAGKTFRVATCTDIPKHTGSILSTVADHTGTKITITTEANAKYLFLNYYNTDNGDTAGEDVIKDSILIEQGSTATTYEDYIEKEIYVKNVNGVFERFYNENELNQQNYSASEQKIGTWIDGKTLYRKTVQASLKAGENAINLPTSSLDLFVNVYGTLIYTSSKDNKKRMMSLTRAHYNTTDNQIGWYYNGVLDKIMVEVGSAYTDTITAYITFEYTKTTD